MRTYLIKGHATEKKSQIKMQWKDTYEKYDGDDIIPYSGRFPPELCGVMGYTM